MDEVEDVQNLSVPEDCPALAAHNQSQRGPHLEQPDVAPETKRQRGHQRHRLALLLIEHLVTRDNHSD